MARFPGTETHVNRAGLRPGQHVRCLRMRANADLGLADRRGLLLQVRLGHARVLLGAQGPAPWLASEQLVTEEPAADPELELLAGLMRALHAERLDFDEGELLVATPGCSLAELEAARALLGPRLLALELRPDGVHELGVRLRVAGLPGPGAAPS
jgi:hypothetical protein